MLLLCIIRPVLHILSSNNSQISSYRLKNLILQYANKRQVRLTKRNIGTTLSWYYWMSVFVKYLTFASDCWSQMALDKHYIIHKFPNILFMYTVHSAATFLFENERHLYDIRWKTKYVTLIHTYICIVHMQSELCSLLKSCLLHECLSSRAQCCLGRCFHAGGVDNKMFRRQNFEWDRQEKG